MEGEKKSAAPGQEEKTLSHRGHNNNSNRPRKGQQEKESRQDTSFKGNNEDMVGHVYTYDGYAKASQFQMTTEKIGEWAKQNCSNFPLDVWKAIETLEEPDQSEWRPAVPQDMNDAVDAAIFKDEVQEYGKRKRAFRDNSTKVYTVAIGQCSEATKAKLEARSDWDGIKGEHNLVKLLKAIKSLMHNQIQDGRYDGLTAFESLKALMNIKQQRHEETAAYRKRFLAATEVLEHVVIAFGAMFQGMADKILVSDFGTTREDASEEEAIEAESMAGEKVLAVMFLKQACPVRYGEIIRELQNDFVKDRNNYPANVTGAYNMLVNWKRSSFTRDSALPLDGMAYTMVDGLEEAYDSESATETVLTTDGKSKCQDKDSMKSGSSEVICSNCNVKGHKWRWCDKPYQGAGAEGGQNSTANAMVSDLNDSELRWDSTFDDDGMYNDGAVLCQVSVELAERAEAEVAEGSDEDSAEEDNANFALPWNDFEDDVTAGVVGSPEGFSSGNGEVDDDHNKGADTAGVEGSTAQAAGVGEMTDGANDDDASRDEELAPAGSNNYLAEVMVTPYGMKKGLEMFSGKESSGVPSSMIRIRTNPRTRRSPGITGVC